MIGNRAPAWFHLGICLWGPELSRKKTDAAMVGGSPIHMWRPQVGVLATVGIQCQMCESRHLQVISAPATGHPHSGHGDCGGEVFPEETPEEISDILRPSTLSKLLTHKPMNIIQGLLSGLIWK